MSNACGGTFLHPDDFLREMVLEHILNQDQYGSQAFLEHNG
jgi:hypothetical protein